jgi:DNA-binding response OmpR family regulator
MADTYVERETQVARILIVDVDSDYQIIFSSLVAVLGETPLVVKSGAEAIAAARDGAVDLAILDASISDVEPLELCRELKNVYPGEFLPVLIMGAQEILREKIRALSEGADDFLAKPFIYEELQARIEALLRIRRLHNRLHQAHKDLQAMQNQLVLQERQLAVGQLATTAAHTLGQPLSSILLNCFLIEQLPKSDPKFVEAVHAVKADVSRMTDLIDRLRVVRADQTATYVESEKMLDVEGDG